MAVFVIKSIIDLVFLGTQWKYTCDFIKIRIGVIVDKIVLASASPRRQQLLSQIGMDFEVVVSGIEEVMEDTLGPAQAAMSLAAQKCTGVALQMKKDCIVIGADTIVVKDNRLLGKPQDRDEALEMLSYLNGAWHEVITGMCLYRTGSGRTIKDYEVTRVKIAKNTPKFLEEYAATGEPLDKAGAYGIQGFGSLIVERVEGCYFNVMGLPLYKLSKMLQEIGYNIKLKNPDR